MAQHQDSYGLELSTQSDTAAAAYRDGMRLYFTAQPGAEAAFKTAIAADPDFALAHLSLSREHHVHGNGKAARDALTAANACPAPETSREQQHLAIMTTIISGRGDDAFTAAKAHLADYPRDALITSTCIGVFSLIGFSGRPGREAENLAMSSLLVPHYGDDPWFLSNHAFAQMEAGQLNQAETSIEASLKGNPKDANAAHHRAHLYYEMGETKAGYAFLTEWLSTYDRHGIMHCHNSWHAALGAMALGDVDEMWRIVDQDVDPANGHGPPLNVMTDLASILFRAQQVGIEVSDTRWARVSDYASQWFPKPRLGFADVHSALVHAFAGRGEALNKIISDANGPVADLVATLGEAFKAMAAQDWAAAEAYLLPALPDHARLGGSRAQRDLIEHAMSGVLMKQGKTEQAQLLLAARRPVLTSA
ncbi:MAG: tetratricopeptide repeat protein [Henriciella sp.]|jgi:tetratricopeptide (TPR) repeat protein